MNKKFDVIIAGQGIAGSLLSWFFIKKGFSVLVVDQEDEITSSRIAGGMIHPITGRRLVKSWKADTFIPFAISTFNDIESVLHKKHFHEMSVLEVFHDNGHRNSWMSKSEDPACADFIGDVCAPSKVPAFVNAPLGGQYVINSGWLDTENFLQDYRLFLQEINSYQTGSIDTSAVTCTKNGIQWNDIEASYFITCTGYEAKVDPSWNWLPFNPAKGEILEIASDELPTDQVIHNRIKIIPLAPGKFKCGATYTWDSLDGIPSAEGLKKLEDGLLHMVNVPYKILSHRAAIRPSTVDRRPFLGKHPQHPQLAIFNGLGTKGVMLAPFLAEQMVDFLMNDQPLDPEFDIARFA